MKTIERMKMIERIVLACMMTGFLLANATAQTAEEGLQKANALYKQFREADALAAYKEVVKIDANNMTALVKCVELSSSLGNKQADKSAREAYFFAAKEYAHLALASNAKNADAYYAQALAYANLSQTEEENKQVIEDVKQIKLNADKGLAINSGHALLNYMEGKWHYEMLDLNWLKKAALKTFYGKGFPKPDIDSAVFYMEKCRSLEPYFVQNYWDLAKAYQLNKKPTMEMEVLSKMVKLPNRTADDAALKAEGKKRLQALE